jgi:signal transduction histidine kinase
MLNSQRPLSILVVEDNDHDFTLLNEYISRTGLPTSNVVHVNRMKHALEVLEKDNPDLIFLDLALPDSEGIESFQTIHGAAPHLSIIILSGLSDKQVALRTILLGAQDYLVKGSFDETLLAKSIEYSIERKKMQEEMIKREIEKQKLITTIAIQAQEKERKLIGRELHDNINQILATAKLYVDIAIREDEVDKELLYKSHEYIMKAIREIRSVSKSLILGSMKNVCLEDALKELINSMKIHSSLSIVLEIEKDATENLAADNKLAIYRIIQEQLSNILKHSEATHASVTLKKFSGKLVVCINDDGVGAESEQKSNGIGLHNIAGRVDMQNGTMEIITAPGKGYLLNIELPLE